MNLRALITLIMRSWTWDPKTYLGMKTRAPSQANAFKRRHVLFHLQKALSTLAGIEEELDHEDGIPYTREPHWKEAAVKLVINSLHLAALIGLTPETLEQEIGRVLAEANPKR